MNTASTIVACTVMSLCTSACNAEGELKEVDRMAVPGVVQRAEANEQSATLSVVLDSRISHRLNPEEIKADYRLRLVSQDADAEQCLAESKLPYRAPGVPWFGSVVITDLEWDSVQNRGYVVHTWGDPDQHLLVVHIVPFTIRTTAMPEKYEIVWLYARCRGCDQLGIRQHLDLAAPARNAHRVVLELDTDLLIARVESADGRQIGHVEVDTTAIMFEPLVSTTVPPAPPPNQEAPPKSDESVPAETSPASSDPE